MRCILKRRAYAYGEFHYGAHTVILPELTIVDPHLFELAQRRMTEGRARAVKERKYDYLLVGHMRCTCGRNVSGTALGPPHRRHLYYDCNTKRNQRHMTTCKEKQTRADAADPLVWDWLMGLLGNEENLDRGLNQLAEQQEIELQPQAARLAIVVDLLTETERKVKRLATAFADEQDDMIAAALRGEMKTAARERDALIAERDSLRARLAAGKMTEAERKAIKELAAEVNRKLGKATFAQKRALLHMLDVQVKLE